WTEVYEPFGAIRTETKNSNSAPANFMKFAGEYQDPTALYYLRARQDDPTLGRFLTRDPAEPSASDPYVSAYLYVADRPTVLLDPSGEMMEFNNDAQLFADEATSACDNSRTADQRIRCSYNFLIGRFVGGSDKYPRIHSAGLVGNFWTETESDPLNPRTVQNNGGPGRGIGQWGVNDRWQSVIDFAQKRRLSQ